RVGTQIGNYRLLRLLGEGGFAEVYLGEHSYLGTHAAIKILHTRVAQGDIAQFQQEARLLANLIHPHIVRVLDFGVADHTPYLVMDYAPGGTLRTRHPKGARLPLPTIVEYVKQIAQALQYAHDQKLIHRDVKPENMLIGRNGEILLSDFGIALIAHSSRYQSTKDMAGTITYMAPEQIEAHPRPASDQYSLGIAVYEWLSGNHPFQGSFTEIAIKHSFTPPPSLIEQLPSLSPALEQIVFTALAKDPKARFANVQAFATALEQASLSTETEPHSSQPPSEALPPIQSAIIPPNQPPPSHSEELVPPIQLASSSIIHTSPNQPMLPTSKLQPATSSESGHEPAERGISRRTLILTAAGTATAGIIGAGVFWFTRPSQPIRLPQSTRSPQGTLFVTYREHTDEVHSVAWSPHGKRIASGSWDSTVQVWNASDGGQVFIYRGHSAQVNLVAWSPDDKRIASQSEDETVQVWNANDGSQVFIYKGHTAPASSVAWSPNGQRVASGSTNGAVQVWNANDGSQAFTYQAHTASVWSVAWSPDGKRIASGSYDHTVRVWNANDGSQAFTYKGHADHVSSVAWSPNGQRIASGSGDSTVQVWNANDGSQAFTYKGHTVWVCSVAWSPDGQRIASGSASPDKTVQVWQAV
ncbi:MAG: protein kinase, partial [Chloroflexi bacterium]|nr:protein kinase [Chloroflexota bacterium]